MAITGKELANILNISATAVSMALNNRPGVSKATREQILAAAKQYGYDFSKLSMKRNRTGSIYLVISKASNTILKYTPIFSEIIQGIESKCREEGYRLKTITLSETTDDIQLFFKEMRTSDCVGILLLGTEIKKETCQYYTDLRVPIILVDAYYESLKCSCITINNEQGAYIATQYLINKYSRQLGYLSSSLRIPNFEERKAGYSRALRENGISLSQSIFHEISPTMEGALSDMLELIDQNIPLANAYFAENDQLAIGTMKALKLRGYRIPEDIAIIGFDNISECQIVDPSLTSIDVPRYFMGETAVEQLIKEINSTVPHTVKIEIATSLIKRSSC